MQNFIIKYIFISILFYSCTDILLNDDQYNSIYLKGGGWVTFESNDVNTIFNNDFSFQMWISGSKNSSDNDAKTLLSIVNEANQIHFGLFRDTSINNGINVYLNGELVETITDDDIDWSTSEFNLLTITSDTDENLLTIYINDKNLYSSIFDFNLIDSDLAIGANINYEQTSVTNFWNGYIDEMRLWDKMLTSEEVIFHNDNPTKLITSNGCSDPQYTTLTLCEEAEGTWSGIYSDQALTKLKGLWRLNYNSPRYDIPDESCKELNLDSGVSDNDECININGTIYTLPGYSVEFSKVGL